MKEMVKSVDSGLAGLYLKSVAHLYPQRSTPLNEGEAPNEEGRKPRQGDACVLSGCLEQGISSICREHIKA